MDKVFKSYKEESRKDYGATIPKNINLSIDQLNCGAILRIAEAVEKMCLDREKLERDYKYMCKRRDYFMKECDKLSRSNAALRGHIRRLKKKKENHDKPTSDET